MGGGGFSQLASNLASALTVIEAQSLGMENAARTKLSYMDKVPRTAPGI